MKNTRNKQILIIVIVVILTIAMISGVITYLFLATDVFKGDKELFVKYLSQNKQTIETMKNSEAYNTYKNLKTEGISETTTNVAISYAEGGEVSNPINELAVRFNTQRDNINNYFYNKSAIVFRDEEYIKAELINDKDISGIRFFVKQFISVRNDKELNKIASAFGIENSKLEEYVQIVNGVVSPVSEIISNEETNTILEKYKNIIISNFQKMQFSHLKNAMITVNNSTIKTNSYTATLGKEDVRNMVLEILNEIQNDEIILNKIKTIGKEKQFKEILNKAIEQVTDVAEFYELKITTYEKGGVLVRTAIEIANNVIFIDNNQSKIKIQRNVINAEQEESQVMEITKTNADGQEVYNTDLIITNGEDIQKINFKNEMETNAETITMNTELKYSKGIITAGIKAETVTNITNEISKKVVLDQSNNVILSDLDDNTMQGVVKTLKENIPELVYVRTNLLKEVLGIKEKQNPNNSSVENPTTPENPQGMTQIEVNRFNAKFEFYTGESVTSQNVQTLLDVVKSNLKNAEITPIAGTEDKNGENPKVNIKLNIEKGVANEELANQILQNIKKGKKYKVSITYKSDNGLIDYINISEVIDKK